MQNKDAKGHQCTVVSRGPDQCVAPVAVVAPVADLSHQLLLLCLKIAKFTKFTLCSINYSLPFPKPQGSLQPKAELAWRLNVWEEQNGKMSFIIMKYDKGIDKTT